MKKSILRSCVISLLLVTGLGGCEKKSGDAIVIGKDYVAAVKQGEQIKDTYRVGKYTGTVWDAQIE
jgi:hypothetical protein